MQALSSLACVAEMGPFYTSIICDRHIDQETGQNYISQQNQWLADLFDKANDMLTLQVLNLLMKSRVQVHGASSGQHLACKPYHLPVLVA